MPPKVEQIEDFLMETERALSGFSLDAIGMRGRLPALRGIVPKLAQAALETEDEELQEYLSILEIRARNCRECIERRLLIKS